MSAVRPPCKFATLHERQASAGSYDRYSYQAYHDHGFPTTEEGRRAVEEATARALFKCLDGSPGDGEQVA